ncbi:hypothetical protein [Ulvibacterium sp.]|uniref:hypothetical protein n=1 Tax=Ulvibacterium sp. TaxID=2665914 RepID=UPI003BA8CE21
MGKLSTRTILGLLLVLVFSSCAEKQDFDQYDDLNITPTYEASIVYLETPENVINAFNGANFYSQDFNFDAFAEDVFSERVLDGVLTYEVENTTSKRLNLTVEFLDDAGNVLDTESFSIDPAPTAVLIRETAYGNAGRSIDIIRNTSGIRLSGTNLGDSISTSTLPDPMVTLKSSGKFRVRIK